MSSTISWRGDAPKVAQVDKFTPASVGVGNTFTITINGKSVTFVATATTVANVTAGLVALLTASTIPEFNEITWADATTWITGTVKTAHIGKPFTATAAASGGSATFTRANLTANSGPADAAIAANYSGGAAPATGDTLVFENSSADFLYNIDTLSGVTLAVLTIKYNYTGRIGLPKQNTDDSSFPYYEYRPDYFQVAATICNIGSGPGSGSGRIKIDFGSVVTTTTVLNTGTSAENGLGAVILKGTNSSNYLEALKGTVSVAPFAGELADLSGGLRVAYVANKTSDATVILGAGVTLATVTKVGGSLTTESAVATANLLDGSGDWTHLAGAITTANMAGGNLFYRSSATLATCNIGGNANLDFRQDPTPRNVTNLNILSAGCQIHDENQTVSWGNPFVLPVGVGLEDITLKVGKGRTITVA